LNMAHRTLGAFFCIRDANRLDYNIKEAIESVLPICDQVAVTDVESTDGTFEFLQEWAKHEPKLRIGSVPWTNPVRDVRWWPGVLNTARERLDTDWAITLDADELIHEQSFDRILKAAHDGETLLCYRYNFWRDAQHLIPRGVCCGTDVIRVGPRSHFFPSDYPDDRAADICKLAKWPTDPVYIYHYGFLRKRDAFFRKAHVMQNIWAGSYDPRLAAVENQTGNWMADPGVADWVDRCPRFSGTHPKAIHQWLTERTYSLT
jgi:glycosyltransferase involved in cell wall biosynthesis